MRARTKGNIHRYIATSTHRQCEASAVSLMCCCWRFKHSICISSHPHTLNTLTLGVYMCLEFRRGARERFFLQHFTRPHSGEATEGVYKGQQRPSCLVILHSRRPTKKRLKQHMTTPIYFFYFFGVFSCFLLKLLEICHEFVACERRSGLDGCVGSWGGYGCRSPAKMEE